MPESFDPFRYKTPPRFDTTAAAIKTEAEDLIKTAALLCHGIVDRLTPSTATFENTIRPLCENENYQSTRVNHLRFYATTHPDQELRNASYAVADLLNNAETDFFSNVNLFHLVDAVVKQVKGAASPTLDDESIHYVNKLHQRFLANGCAISDNEVRQELVSKKRRINELAKQCRKNMANESTGLWLTHDELRGMPQSFMGRLTEGDGERTGRFWVSTKPPFSFPVLSHATEEATRKKVYYAVMNRMPENVALHRELVLLRDETARMLGWPHHFAFKTSQKMMQSSTKVLHLLEEVREALKPVAEKSANDMRNLKLEDAKGMPTNDVKVFHWDMAYYETKADQTMGNDESFISEYFELESTLEKLLGIYVRIFGVRFVPVEIKGVTLFEHNLTWHEDVRMFSAWNVDTTEPGFLGYAYFDLHPREGKFTHAGQYALQRRYQKPDGSWFHPCSCLVMNYMKPSPERPTLLDFNDVRSLFHELGHMYHCLLSRPRYAGLHAVDSDFVETPSMMLEQFFWDPQVIHEVSNHYSYLSPAMKEAWLSTQRHKTDDGSSTIPVKISLELAVRLGAHETTRRVRKSLNELFFATYDLLVHSPQSHEDLEKINLAELYNRTRGDIFRTHGGEILGDGWEYSQGQTVFRAIQGKYDAGYYAYLLGRMFAINIFDAGFAGDVMNKENGRRYRDMVLCKGGSQPEMKTLTDYLGREPSSKPYLAWLGVRDDPMAEK